MLVGLHGQHSLAHHHVVAGIRQSGLLRPGVHDRVVGVVSDAPAHDFSRLWIKIYTRVGLGAAFDDFERRNA